MPRELDWSPALSCPSCRASLTVLDQGTIVCDACGTEVAIRNCVYQFLRPDRLAEIEPILAQYRRVRADEGYRSLAAAQYRSLPQVDPGVSQAERWQVRRQSFANLCRHVLRRSGLQRLRVLDLGAGNGWLSNRLTQLGHRCVAVDLLDDAEDGLGALHHYASPFTCLRADFDDLPLAPGQFDLVVFNASLHYSSDVASTLRHARQRLVDGGTLVVMDSPTFTDDETGRRMLAGQRAEFEARYGSVQSWGVGYLTEKGLEAAAQAAGVNIESIRSRGSAGWALRRAVAGVRERRELARFGIWFGVWHRNASVNPERVAGGRDHG